MKRRSKLTVRLALAFSLSTLAMAVVCTVALVDLVSVSDRTTIAVSREIELLRNAAAFDALLYQKGFVANYMLTGDRIWLRKLEATRARFSAWVDAVEATLAPDERRALELIVAENAAYDRSRSETIALFEAGRRAEAIERLSSYQVHIDRLVELAQRFNRIGRAHTEEALIDAERSISRLAWLLVATSVISAVSSLVVGFLWARRIAQPMYQLQLQIESAAERTRVQLAPAPSESLDGLADHVMALVSRVEETNAALAAQRRRLIQSEKMSAVGELAAKLGHEILNPLAGMKAAVQLLALQADAGELAQDGLREASAAIAREVTRVDQLVRRLIGYARPLAPEVEVCAVGRFLEAAREAVAPQLSAAAWRIEIDEEPGIPPLEVDPLLMTQVFVNLMRNAAEAMPAGGRIHVRAQAVRGGERDEVRIEVTDEGAGVTAGELPLLFTPFRSTKLGGHGLGLATSRNIVLEHGGTLEGRNRDGTRGAVFSVSLPCLR